MAALTADRDTQEKANPAAMVHAFTPDASTQFYKGGLVCVDQGDSGLLKKGATSTTLVCVGVSQDNYLSPASGAKKVKARSGIFKFENSAAADEIAADDVGKDCYVVDDQTVALTDGTSTRSKAGKIYDVDADGVWVAINFPGSNA